jgi:cytochrome o ubiquinol oxidase operon protein cyoD
MKKKPLNKLERQKNTLAYALLACVVLSFATYIAVEFELLNGWALFSVITVFALMQLVIQLVFCLEIQDSEKPRFNVMVFFYTFVTVFILVAGSIWIMYNLDYNHGVHDNMDAIKYENYLIEDEGIN